MREGEPTVEAIDVPDWFATALAAKVEDSSVTVGGVKIAYRAWGRRGAPGVVLVHGSAAHANWWDHIGPALADGARVVALSLSGHGESERRPEYSAHLWADELMAVAEAAGADRSPVLVAHSMGAQPAALLAVRPDLDLRGVVFIDWAARTISADRVHEMRSRALRRYRTRPTLSVAMGSFRPKPEAPDALPFVLNHIARHSFHEADDRTWQLAFDPAIYDRRPTMLDDLTAATCPTLLLRAGRSIITDEIARLFGRRMGSRHRQVDLPGTYHHVMLGQPLALVAALSTQLAN